MKKLIISAICLLALAAGVSSYVYYRTHQIVAKNQLAIENVDALTTGELPGGWCKNFKSATVWYISGSSVSTGVSLTEPGVIAQLMYDWTSMVCCIEGTDMDACDMNCENDECKRRVTRPACN